MSTSFDHFIERTKERYNIDLTIDDLLFIAERIKQGKAKLVKASSRGFKYKVRVKGKLVIIVMNRSHSSFITALPYKKQLMQVSFNNSQYYYLDALYINELFKLHFDKNIEHKYYCPKCSCTDIVVDLGKDRFRCSNCGETYAYKKLVQPDLFSSEEKGYKLKLTSTLWWYLYKNESELCVEDLKIEPLLEDNDKLLFLVQDSSSKIVVPLKHYAYQILKEKLNEQQILCRT